MPRVRVVHLTEYRYVRPVRLTQHRLMLRPRDSHDLRLLEATLGLSPNSYAHFPSPCVGEETRCCASHSKIREDQ